MSRIVLTRHDNGQERFVVGWDHPCRGAFWQEFNREPDPDPETGEVDRPDDFEEVARDGGFFPGIPLAEFRQSVPEDLRPLITGRVMEALRHDEGDSESGYVLRDWTPIRRPGAQTG